MNLQKLYLRSRGFEHRKGMEQRLNLDKTITDIADDTGLSVTTVRKWVSEPDMNVKQAEVGAAFILASYFGVTLNDMVVQGPDIEGDSKPTRGKGHGKPGRPAKPKKSTPDA